MTENEIKMPHLTIVPITFKTACDFISQHHRHHKPTVGCKFCIGAEHDGKLVGVAVCGCDC